MSGNLRLLSPPDQEAPKEKHLEYWIVAQDTAQAEIDKWEKQGKQSQPLSKARLRLVLAKLQIRVLKAAPLTSVEKEKAAIPYATKLEELSDMQPRSSETKEEGAQLIRLLNDTKIRGFESEDLAYL